MALTRKAALFLRATFILLCKLFLVDLICSFVIEWLVYFLLIRKRLTPPNSKGVRSQDDPGIQVILCGFPRTGCTSLLQAMEILGFPCFHGAHLYKPTTAKLYMKAQASGAHQDWEHLLHGYRSIVDYPAASSYTKLMEMYPNAKVILNMRDSNNWYNSFSQTIMKARDDLVFQVVQTCVSRCLNMFVQKQRLDKFEDKGISIAHYKIHLEEVKRHVPSHKLYVLDIEKNEGWIPLCNFLEVPTPNVPFPFLNKRDHLNKRLGKQILIYRTVILSYLVLLFGIIGIPSWKRVMSM